jgi:hypothetical protein
MCTQILKCGKSSCCFSSDMWSCVFSGVDEKSLEEISLKLIKSFLQEKTELEEQYAQVLQLFLRYIQQESKSLCYDDAAFWLVLQEPVFSCVHKTVKSNYKLSESCLSISSHGTTRLPMDRFSLNFIFEDFLIICWENSGWLKYDKNNGYLTWRPM